jgi:hypothetical protein
VGQQNQDPPYDELLRLYGETLEAHAAAEAKAKRYKELYESALAINVKQQKEREGWRQRVNAALDGIKVVERWD